MIFVAMCVVMLGTAPLAALCNHLAMGAVPPDKAGSGASIVQTTTELGLGLGIATLATLGTAVYRGNVEGALGALPPDAADAARESVDRAVAAAAELPAEQGGDLLAAARDAFTSGVHVVGVVSAVFYAGLAVLAVRAFRHVRNSHGGEDDTTNEDQETDPVSEAASATEA
jgi:DHA2 family multidrug resistance protein-like MFS transporter